jgi:2-iminobutanoate/2-iminopropanoate deaminase
VRADLQQAEWYVVRRTNLGSGLDRVVKVTVFLSDWKYFKEMNEAFAEFFATDHPPARSTIQGTRWPEGHLVAIEAIALAE